MAIRLSFALSVLVAFLFTPFPRQWGVFEFLFSLHPFLVGILPLSVSSEQQWGFTFEDLYGDGGYSDPIAQNYYRDRLSGQTAVVTGANSGIGFQISLALARLGVNVTMACRNPSRCENAARKIRDDEIVMHRRSKDGSFAVVTMTVDTSSLQSVKEFCLDFRARTDDGEGNPLPLDMLFLNAGMSFASLTEDGSLNLSKDGIERTFATNVVGHHLMYKLLEPSIRRSDELRKTPARIVQTSSCMSYTNFFRHKVATDLQTLNGARAQDPSLYAQTKLAQILWTQELTARLDAEAINANYASNQNAIIYANAGNPGAVATHIWHTHEGLTMSLWAKFCKYLARLHQSLFWTAEEGALTLLYLGTAVDDLQNKNIRGQYFHPQTKRMVPPKLFWRENEKQTKMLQENMWKFLDDLVADFV